MRANIHPEKLPGTPVRMPRHRKESRAFTLIELLVACAVAILMMALLTSLMTSATDTSKRVGSTLQASSMASALLDVMEGDFRSALILSGTNQWMNISTVQTNVGAVGSLTNSTVYMITRSIDPAYTNGVVDPSSLGIPRAIRYEIRQQPLATNETSRLGFFRSVWGASSGQTPVSTFTNFLNRSDLKAAWGQHVDTNARDVFADVVIGMRVELVCRASNGTITNLAAHDTIAAAGTDILVDGVAPAARPVGFNVNLEILPAQLMSRIDSASAAEFSARRLRDSRQYSRFIPLDQLR